MTHQSQIDDPLYKNWVKGGLASKYLKEGLEFIIDNALVNMQRMFLSDICNHLTLKEAKCTDCTTANCIPCPTNGICYITGKGRHRKCSYHVKGDAFKEYKKCPNDVCDNLRTKLTSQHRNGRPAWQNTDATKWCTDHWEIAKCFLPPAGYADKTSMMDIDCSGLLKLAINCLDVQTHLDLYLAPPNGILSQILNFRNKIFHSAPLSLTTDELEEYIDLMTRLLCDKKELADDPQAQNAVIKLIKLKDEGFFISTKDESEIRKEIIDKFQQEIQNDYLGRKQVLQDSLCQIYQEHFKTIPFSPLLDDIEAEIDDVFVELVLCDDSIYSKDSCENTRYNGRKIKNYKDIFYIDKEKCKNIYVIGDAGMGKTTWCMKLLRSWVSAQNNKKISYTKDQDHQSKPVESTQLGINNRQQKPESDPKKQQNQQEFDQAWSAIDIPIQNELEVMNLNQEQNTKMDCINCYENAMAEFDIVLFVSLRHAIEDGNIREMIKKQLFQENTYLNELTTEALQKDHKKCLIIVDGLDEWACPDNFKCSSLLQHPSLPGREGLNGCSILTTTRPWKLNDIRLQSKDIDKTIKIQGIEDVGLLAQKVIYCKNKTSETNIPCSDKSLNDFKMDLESAFKIKDCFNWRHCNFEMSFLKVPLILIFIVCTWFDNGRLEKTWAGNFNGFIECLLSMAEKGGHSRRKGRLTGIDGLESLKKDWTKSIKFLPKCLQSFDQCSSYSQLLLKLGKLAFELMFDSNGVCLVFTESHIRSKLTIKELEVAVKSGILSQSKVVGKTLTNMSSLSFLHKTIQEHLAAVYICSSADGHEEAIQTYANYCLLNIYTEDNVRKFIIDINFSIVYDLCKHFAKYHLHNDNQLELCDMFNEWKSDIGVKIQSKSPRCCLYGALLSGTDHQTLELKQNAFLNLIECIRDVTKEDDDIIDLDDTFTWFPESPYLPTRHLRTVQLLQVNSNGMSMNIAELYTIDLLHCKHLEDVSFKDMKCVQVILNHSNLTAIKLENILYSGITVFKTETSYDGHVKQLEMIHMRNLKICNLILPAVFWKIEKLNVMQCHQVVIKIDTVLDTSLTSRHVINTADYMHKGNNSVKLEAGNELKVDNLILYPDKHAHYVDLKNPCLTYSPNSLVLPENQSLAITSTSLNLFAPNISLTCLKLKANSFDYTDLARCLCKMNQLEKIHVNLEDSRDGTIEMMRSLQSLPRLRDLGLTMYNCYEDIVAEYLSGMKYLKVLKLYPLSKQHQEPQDVHAALSASISKLSNIDKLELKCVQNSVWFDYPNCCIGQILLHSLPHLSKLKHLHCTFENSQCVEALSISLPKMADLEKLCLTYDFGCLNEVLQSLAYLTKLKHFVCKLQNQQEILTLTKSALTMTNLETLDITLTYHNTDMLSSLQGLSQLTNLKCTEKLQKEDIIAISISVPELVNLKTLSVELDCDKGIVKNFTDLLSLNKHLHLTLTNSSWTGYDGMTSPTYTAKYCSSYTPCSGGHTDSAVKESYWEIKNKKL